LIDFLLLGLVGTFSLFPGSLREKLFRYAGLIVFLSGATAIVGYTFTLPLLYYDFGSLPVPMALNTAVCFMLLGFGMTQIYKPETK
jgi:hypothetical protein